MMFVRKLINANQLAIREIGKELTQFKTKFKRMVEASNDKHLLHSNALKELAERNAELTSELDRLADWKSDTTKNLIKLQIRVTQLEKQK